MNADQIADGLPWAGSFSPEKSTWNAARVTVMLAELHIPRVEENED